MFSQSYHLDRANDTLIHLAFWLVLSILILIWAKTKHWFHLPENQEVFPKVRFSSLLIGFVIYLGSTVLLAYFTRTVFYRFFSDPIHQVLPTDLYVGISSFVMILLPLVFLFFYLYQFRRELFISFFSFQQHFWKNLWIGFASCFLILPFVIFFSSFLDAFLQYIYKLTELPDQLAVDFLKSSADHPILVTLAIISIIFLSPIVEEILFRGLFQNWLRSYLNRRWTIFCVSLFFTLFHYARVQGLGNIVILTSLFILAWGLSYIYEKQGSLYAPISLHITFNTLNVIQLIIM